jgi:hypothetical protein
MIEQEQPNHDQLSPQITRVLVLAWVGIVALVIACVLLAMKWSLNGSAQAGQQAALAATGTRPTPTPTLLPAATATPTSIPGLEATLESGTPLPTPTIPAIQDLRFGYGIQAAALDNPDQVLDEAQQLGMGWVEQEVRWADVEPEAGKPNWDRLDAFFAAAAARNLRVLVSVSAAPNWARSVTAEDLSGPPDDPQSYINFVTQLVQRYRGAVHAVEIWSEMNQDRSWYVAGGLSAAGYMKLLIPAADAIHAADPNVIVISGGLNPTGIDDGVTAIDDFRYLQTMLDSGLLDHVDCVGVHHKGYNLPPDVPYDSVPPDNAAYFQGPINNPHHSWSFYSTLRGYHDMIVAAGRQTPLCVTAFGWATADGFPGQPQPELLFALDNSAQQQADYLVKAFQMMVDWKFVWLAFVDNLNYGPDSAGNPQDAYYSILTLAGRPRPAFEALKAIDKQP